MTSVHLYDKTLEVYQSSQRAATYLVQKNACIVMMVELRRWDIVNKEEIQTTEHYEHPLFFSFRKGGTSSFVIPRTKEMLKDFTQTMGRSWMVSLTISLEDPYTNGSTAVFHGEQPDDWQATSIFVRDTNSRGSLAGWTVNLQFEREDKKNSKSSRVLSRVTVKHDPDRHFKLNDFLGRHAVGRVITQLLPITDRIHHDWTKSEEGKAAVKNHVWKVSESERNSIRDQFAVNDDEIEEVDEEEENKEEQEKSTKDQEIVEVEEEENEEASLMSGYLKKFGEHQVLVNQPASAITKKRKQSDSVWKDFEDSLTNSHH
jgi:hypothetical protein